jgi:hypothetical protein
LINAFAHIVGSIRASAYNPGTLTTVVLFLPLSLWMLRTVLAADAIEKGDVPRVVASGVATHAVLLASLTLQKRRNLMRLVDEVQEESVSPTSVERSRDER